MCSNKLIIENLSKTYSLQKEKALDIEYLDFDNGIYGILGPNGSGKSTLFNLITNIIKRDSGSIKFNDDDIFKNIEDFKNYIGFIPQQQSLYPHLTIREFINYMALLKNVNKKQLNEEVDRILKTCDIYDIRHKKISNLSGGMKQRVLISQALINNPKILILDEPTAALDPKQRVKIKNFLSEISKDKIVLISTHVVSDIEHISKEIILMRKGKIIIKDTPVNILNKYKNIVYELIVNEDEFEEINKLYNISKMQIRHDGSVYVKIYGDFDEIPEINGKKFEKSSVDLEDVYLYCFGDE